MTTLAQVRKAALALAEVEETTHFGMVAFKVRGKGFASVTKDKAWLQVNLEASDAENVIGEIAGAELILRSDAVIGVKVPLGGINGMQSNALVYRAWLARAPKKLARVESSAATADVGSVGDLHASIGRPATRALAGAGLSTLKLLSTWTKAAVLDLHGVGPKAVDLLERAMAEQGLDFKA
jgi:hypothetical protein